MKIHQVVFNSIFWFGDNCKKNNKQRQFTVNLPCADKLNPIPLHAYEVEHCSYSIDMPSVYGCPLECPVSNRQLCGGNGHCSYDYDKGAARCFCNHGYGGASCSQAGSDSSSSSYSPALTGLIITLFIIIMALVASIIYMYKQVTAYKDDMAHYQVLRGGEDDAEVFNPSSRSANV